MIYVVSEIGDQDRFFRNKGVILDFFKKIIGATVSSFNCQPENTNFKQVPPKIGLLYGSCLRVFRYFFGFIIL